METPTKEGIDAALILDEKLNERVKKILEELLNRPEMFIFMEEIARNEVRRHMKEISSMYDQEMRNRWPTFSPSPFTLRPDFYK